MTNTPETPVKDPHYDLIRVLEASLQNAWQVQTYIADAERAGDTELTEWFSKIQHNSLKAGEQGKRLLHERLGRDSQATSTP